MILRPGRLVLNRALGLSLAGVFSAVTYSQTTAPSDNSAVPMASINVLAGRPAPFRIPRTIYGTFLEHIGQSVFGGVSAQLLDNPSLEAYPATPGNAQKNFAAPEFQASTHVNVPLPWLPLTNVGRRYALRSDLAANSHSSLYVMGLPHREVGIRQSIYIPVERERVYHGVLFAFAAEGPVSLKVSFRRHEQPDEVLAFSVLELPQQGRWMKLPFSLTVPPGAVAPLQPVDFAIATEDGGRVLLDEIRLYPADAVRGLDPDIIQLSERLHTPLLRYGGNFSSGYHWRDGVGPLDQRPTRLNEAWGTPEYNEFGTDELMDFCHRINALPQICLNLGSGSVREAREWVEYCQGSRNSPQGRQRMINGHPTPYPVGAWELGNELYDDGQLGWQTPETYADRYLKFFQGIRSLVPPTTRILATGGEIDSFSKWNGALLSQAGAELRYITTHLVADLEQTRDQKANRDQVIAADLALPVGVGRELDSLRDQIESFPSTRNRVKVSYSEWMFRSPAGSLLPNYDNMGGAVIAAGWLNMLVRHAEFIPMANMTGLVEFAGIYKRRGRAFVTPQYWALYLYANYAGDTLVETETRVASYKVHNGQLFAPEIPAVPFLDVLATVSSSSGEASLFVVNRDPVHARQSEIHLSGFNPAQSAKVITLSAPSLLARNDEEHPDAIHPVESSISLEGKPVRYTFPPASLTVLLLAQNRR